VDRDYRAQLDDLLREAQLQDDQSVIADVNARLAVLAKYKSEAPPRALKTLKFIGTIPGQGELVLTKKGIQWRGVTNGTVSDMTVNGQAWEPGWGGTQWVHETEVLPMDIDEIADWKCLGSVNIRKVPRGPTATGFVTSNKGGPATTFTLIVHYRSSYVPRTVEEKK
jgi:hypothetical protein